MKLLMALAASFGFVFAAMAQSMSGDIIAVETATGTIRIGASGGEQRTYHARPSVEVTINGAKGKFNDLAPGMTVRVTTGEPGVATRLEAVGAPAQSQDGVTFGADLEQKLIGTTWIWNDSKTTYEAITLKANGIASSNARPRAYTWKVTPGGNHIDGVTPFGKKFRIIFDSTLVKGRIVEADGRPRETKLVPK